MNKSIVSDELMAIAKLAGKKIIDALGEDVIKECEIREYRPENISARNSSNVLAAIYKSQSLFIIRQLINRHNQPTGTLYISFVPYSGSSMRYKMKKDGTFNTELIASYLCELVDIISKRSNKAEREVALRENADAVIGSILNTGHVADIITFGYGGCRLTSSISYSKQNKPFASLLLNLLKLELDEADILRKFLADIAQKRRNKK